MTVGAPIVGAITGASVMGPDGTFSRRSIGVVDGRFSESVPGDGARIDGAVLDGVVLDGAGTWVIPGVYDCHGHVSWSDFHAADRERRSPSDRHRQAVAALEATLRSGVVEVRDAGGASAELRDEVASGAIAGPRLQVAVDMLGPEVAGDVDRVRAAVDLALDRGARWIKLVATAGVGSPAGTEPQSHFTDEEFRVAVTTAAARGAQVMVHAWGGRAIDAAVDAGVASIEHGIFLTARQAAAAAAAGAVFVPTLTIYREVQRMVLADGLPGVSPERIAGVIAAHRTAIAVARDARLAIALGSDFGTTDQHGRNLTEIASLLRAGLSGPEALLAATSVGAALLGVADGGSIVPGNLADAVVLSADPADPLTFEDARNVAAVVQNGHLVHVRPSSSPPLPQQIRSTS